MRRWLLLLGLAAVPVFVPLAGGSTEPKAKLIRTIPVPPIDGIPQQPIRIYDGMPEHLKKREDLHSTTFTFTGPTLPSGMQPGSLRPEVDEGE
jgi:hypothetical protein